MATKFKKLPKKPKASASLATMENYLRKVAEVKKFNQKVKSDKARKETLRKKIQGISSDSIR